MAWLESRIASKNAIATEVVVFVLQPACQDAMTLIRHRSREDSNHVPSCR